MKFKLVETIDKSYERFFHIVKNEAGNYLAMHNDENKAHTRYLMSGEYHADPFCWGRRKADVIDALNDIVTNTPVDANEMFMEKHQALRLGVHTYDGQELPAHNKLTRQYSKMDENAIGNNNEINKKKYKKHSQSPFTKLGTDPEKNIAAFNKANNVGKIPTSGSGMSGNGDSDASSGGDAGGAGAEA